MTGVSLTLDLSDACSSDFSPSSASSSSFRRVYLEDGFPPEIRKLSPSKLTLEQVREMQFCTPEDVQRVVTPVFECVSDARELAVLDLSGFDRLIRYEAVPDIPYLVQQPETLQDPGLRLVFGAMAYAAEQHKAQARKDEAQTPYIIHPVGVARILWEEGCVRDAFTLAAAILHDVIEDTSTTECELRQLFQGHVTGVVSEVSDPPDADYLTCRRLQEEHAPKMSVPARLVKIADKAYNVRDVRDHPPWCWDDQQRFEYVDHSRRVVDGAGGLNPELESYFYGLCRGFYPAPAFR